ncbi:MAG TPA: SLC13 family permease, partial [Novosphingobium sp.]|nr:SLC13 family permease [Novosphingobium sp.]
MTGAQLLSFALIGGAVAVFAWGRFRYDVVALAALAIAMATGDVSVKQAFSGFTSDVVVIIACALVVSAAIARSGVIEWAVGSSMDRLRGAAVQVPVLAGTTALLSMMTKNVGALAIMLPIGLRVGRKEGSSVSSLLMPMAFMSLLGGLVTLVGTSTNIIVSQIREETLGKPFQMFDFAPVGLILTALGFVFVSFGWRLLPGERQARVGIEDAAGQAPYVTEARVPETLPGNVATIADLKLGEAGVTLRAIVHADGKSQPPLPDATLRPGSSLVLEGGDKALDTFLARAPLDQSRDARELVKDEAREEVRSIEAVVQPGSILIDSSAERTRLQDMHSVQLMGIGRSGERITQRLRDVRLRAGDVLVLRAGEKALPEALGALGLLPLVERMVKLGDRRAMFLPVGILAVAMVLVAFKLVPIAGAFFGAAVAMVLVGALSMREAYGALEP